VKRNRLLRPKTELSEPLQLEMGAETCMNPWNGVCDNMDIALYIYRQGVKIPICRECWKEIASEDIEWRFD
jgi:hypothetical protein